MISHFHLQFANLPFGNADENLAEFSLGSLQVTFTFQAVWLLLLPGGIPACPEASCATQGAVIYSLPLHWLTQGWIQGPGQDTPCLPGKPILSYSCNAAEGGLIKITALFFPGIPEDIVLGRSCCRCLLPATKTKEPRKPLPKAHIEACFHPALFWRQLNVCFWLLAVHDAGGWGKGSVS